MRKTAEEKKRKYEEDVALRAEEEQKKEDQEASKLRKEEKEIEELLQQINTKIEDFKGVMIPLSKHMTNRVPFWRDGSGRSAAEYCMVATTDKRVEVSISGRGSRGYISIPHTDIRQAISELDSNSSRKALLQQFLLHLPIFEQYYVDNMEKYQA